MGLEKIPSSSSYLWARRGRGGSQIRVGGVARVMARTPPSVQVWYLPPTMQRLWFCLYIRECKRAFCTRIKDHTSAYDTNQPHRSAFARHLLGENHQEADEEILHVERNHSRRLVLEGIEIVKHETHHRYKALNQTTDVSEPLILKVFASSLHTIKRLSCSFFMFVCV